MTVASGARKSMEPWLRDEVEFHPWQIVGIRTLARWPSFLLADDMGLGKSLQALVVFIIDVFMGLRSSCLIVCPPTLIGNWCDEIEKHTRIPYMVLDGSPKKRDQIILEFAAMPGPKILIIGYPKITKHVRTLNALRFDAGIFDEAHYIKGPTSKRTEACHALSNGRSMLLTGTPMLGHVSDLWGLLYKIDPNGTPSYWTFINRYAVFGGYQDKQIIGVKNERELRKRVENVMLRRLAKDHLNLDEPFIVPRKVDLSVEARRIYDKAKSDLKLERAEGATDDEIKNSLVKFMRLKQICSNTLAFNGKDDSPKLDLCMEDDADLFEQGEKVIIFTQFREMQESYVRRHTERYKTKDGPRIPVFQLHGDIARTSRVPIVKQWGAVNGPAVIVCMIQIASEGLNMVESHEIGFLDKDFVPAKNDQCIGRSHRLGQIHPVRVREYMARGTVESRVETIIKTKRKLFGNIVENSPEWRKKLLQLLIENERFE